MLAASDAIGPDDLGLPVERATPPSALEGPSDELLTLEDAERRHIARVLDLAKVSRTRAATMLGISRSTLWEKGKKYNLL
jgi:transcriptional regulator with PAS, ATPase and Fis domain